MDTMIRPTRMVAAGPLAELAGVRPLSEVGLWKPAGKTARQAPVLARNGISKPATGTVFQVWDQSHRARLFTLNLRPLPARSTEEHRQVLAAIRAGNVAAARKDSHGVALNHVLRTSR